MALHLQFLPLCRGPTWWTLKHGNHTLKGYRSNISITNNIQCINVAAQTVKSLRTKCHAICSDYDSMISPRSGHSKDETQKIRVLELKENVKHLLADELIGPLAKLELIDAIKKLGVGYHFEEEIQAILSKTNKIVGCSDDDLYSNALRFRLLRDHGYDVTQDIFKSFQEEMGNFKACLCEDVKGMLSLYEASHLGFENENIMDEAKSFTTKHLKNYPNNGNINTTLGKKSAHSLELASYLRLPRGEARWYIDIYRGEETMIPSLFELAILEYNVVQGTHQKEITNVARWWEDLGLHKLSFVRDRIMMNYFWSVEMISEPQFGHFREELTKVAILLTAIDDLYETHGSLEELELFTDAVERWNVAAVEQLPQHMKLCYMALLNANNNIGYQVLKEQGYDITSHQKKAWVKLCKAYLVEAKWFHQKHTPSVQEYLDNGVYSASVPLALINCYFLTTKTITEEAINCIELLDSQIYLPSIAARLADDLAASKDEHSIGSKQCYMDELGVSEEVACEHIRKLIRDNWKKMNKARVSNHTFSEPFTSATTNICRIAECFSSFGDPHGDPSVSLENLMSTVFEPIPLN
ncbi:hypothetical protein IFM89_020429 [Coptis chinensis]|uniref:Uncharacterized protein n=1 Tax=Coptis chinensis TaxID=261450 RepID=A0A835HR32_9MAGN|nr:hypothetical protein IFM89_020429 [Coptis chinensis]